MLSARGGHSWVGAGLLASAVLVGAGKEFNPGGQRAGGHVNGRAQDSVGWGGMSEDTALQGPL